MKNDLKGKVALIFGGTGEIGLAIAEDLKNAGMVVVRHGKTGAFAADVGERSQTIGLLEKVIKKHKRVDVAINCISAPIRFAPIDKKNWRDFLEQLSVQLKLAIDSLPQLMAQMKNQGSGTIINVISSVTVGTPPKLYADYVTAKYAVLGLSKCLAAELKQNNILVYCISPDFIKTKLTANFPEKLGEILANKNPSGKLTLPRDVASAILLLCSGNHNYSSGDNLIIEGGKIKQHHHV